MFPFACRKWRSERQAGFSRPASRPRFRPCLEILEDRTLLSTFMLMVNPAVDNAGAVAELKADLATANADGQADTLSLYPGGVYTLTAVDNMVNGANGLPAVAGVLTINGQGATIERRPRRARAGLPPARRLGHAGAGGPDAAGRPQPGRRRRRRRRRPGSRWRNLQPGDGNAPRGNAD